ncbi:MAG: carbohydrate porin [Candidatus Obscuribacterales bacterium]|nr:carbohydrate porin [Candidatus Obscuribacterales bacterium]
MALSKDLQAGKFLRRAALLLSSISFCFFGQVQAKAQSASNMVPASADPSGQLQPVQVRSTELLARYVADLAARHKIAGPDPSRMNRQQLGEYFMALAQKLGKLPLSEMSRQDYQDIGMLTREFEDVYNEIHGRLAMTVLANQMPDAGVERTALPQKLQEFSDRFKALETVRVSGDYTFFPQSDMGSKQTRQQTAANQRGRINVTAKVFEAKPEDKLGDAYLFMRLSAATGRFFPRNRYLMSPTNDINDSVASPFNSGINDVQLPNLVINNNNSNSVRPTVSMEQAYYTQDMRFGKGLKGNYKAGLIYFGNMFDNNNIANSEHLQFANTSFVNSVSWRPNFVGPSTVWQLEKSLCRDKAFLRGTAGIISLSDRDYFGGFGTNYELQLGHKMFNKEGNIRAGYWNFNFRGGSKPPFVTPSDITGTGLLAALPGGTTNGSQPTGAYFNFDQRIWKDIGVFGRYAFNDKQFGQVFLGGLLSSRASWSLGAEIPMKLITKKRPDDVLGVAYGQISPYNRDGTVTPATPAYVSLNGIPATTLSQVNSNLSAITPGFQSRNEKVLEAYYRFQLNKNVSISPDIQYIWSPGAVGPQPGVFVLGSRLTVTF